MGCTKCSWEMLEGIEGSGLYNICAPVELQLGRGHKYCSECGQRLNKELVAPLLLKECCFNCTHNLYAMILDTTMCEIHCCTPHISSWCNFHNLVTSLEVSRDEIIKPW